jgi:hypothetical protein
MVGTRVGRSGRREVPRLPWRGTLSRLGVVVLAIYRPKPGKDAELLGCIRDHMPILRSQHLITDRKPIVGRAGPPHDGTIIEVFEWKSEQAIDEAHRNAEVMKLWDRFHACCEYIAPADAPGCDKPFPNFEAIDL